MADNVSLENGDRIPVLHKTAYMLIDPDGRNVIHTDDYAKEKGLRGALVGGSILLSYVLEMLYNYFGTNWLYHGKINVSFIGGGAINGDNLTAAAQITEKSTADDGVLLKMDVWLETEENKKILVGKAECIK